MFCSNLAFAQEKPCNFIKFMEEAKNTARAVVRIGYDGLVHKTFKGPQARERYENELRVLQFLDQRGCSFVPKVVKVDNPELYLVTTNCGARVDHLSDKKKELIFAELKQTLRDRERLTGFPQGVAGDVLLAAAQRPRSRVRLRHLQVVTLSI